MSEAEEEYSSDHERDVVIDTNVLKACENDAISFNPEALDFLAWFTAEEDLCWAMDDNGKKRPLLDTSVLWSEYHTTLDPVGTAMLLFAQLSARQRVVFSDRPSESVRNKIAKLIPRNKKDRAVLGAATTACSRWLVSEDDDDFPMDVRDKALDLFGVQITGVEARVA